jgi:hypothetical protein
MSATYKETYRGRSIYWHGRLGYGDETRAFAATMREAKAIIDAIKPVEVVKCGVEECLSRTGHQHGFCDRHAPTV